LAFESNSALLTVDVLGSIYGKDLKKARLTFETSVSSWPSTVVPLRDNRYIILILTDSASDNNPAKSEHGKPIPSHPRPNKSPFRIAGVLPAASIESERADTQEKAAHIISRHVRATLKKENDTERMRELILMFSRVAAKSDAEVLRPYLRHSDEWVRRAAIAAMARLDPSSETIRAAESDLRHMLQSHALSDSTIRVYGGDRSVWKTQSLLFQHYSFLGSDSRQRDEINRRYRDLYRVVAIDSKDRGDALEYGLRPLCSFGDERDIEIVGRFRNDTDPQVREIVRTTLKRWERRPGKK
jgi:hypothetical protein